LNGLALCSGFCGIERGLESRIDGFKTICHVEGEAYAAANLVKKIQEGTIHEAPVWSNLKTFNGKPWRSKVDIITGGFPCQPHSSAGKLLAEEDPRNLWPDVKRIISEVRPRIIFLENVSNINNTIAPSIVGDLAQMGFDSAWCVVRASDIGAPHRRARWFIMAIANSYNSNEPNMRINESFEGTSKLEKVTLSDTHGQSSNEELQRTNREIFEEGRRLQTRKDERKARGEPWGKSENDVADTHGERRNKNQFNIRGGKLDLKRSCSEISNTYGQRNQRPGAELRQRPLFKRHIDAESIESRRFEDWWAVEPSVGRMVDGVAYWVDRLRGCGNGVVPQQAAYAFDILSTALMNQMEGEI
jgi:DNA (cytosine-5)-methyltransferase 1